VPEFFLRVTNEYPGAYVIEANSDLPPKRFTKKMLREMFSDFSGTKFYQNYMANERKK
jgi:hypothetical protein